MKSPRGIPIPKPTSPKKVLTNPMIKFKPLLKKNHRTNEEKEREEEQNSLTSKRDVDEENMYVD